MRPIKTSDLSETPKEYTLRCQCVSVSHSTFILVDQDGDACGHLMIRSVDIGDFLNKWKGNVRWD